MLIAPFQQTKDIKMGDDTIVRRCIGTECWSPPDPLVVERDLTLRIYNNRISEYLVYGNSAFWPDGRILGCEFPVRNIRGRLFFLVSGLDWTSVPSPGVRWVDWP